VLPHDGFGDSSVDAHVVASCPCIRGPAAVPSMFLASPAVPSFNAEHMFELMMAEHADRVGLVAPVSSPLTCVISDQVMADILIQEALRDAAVDLPVVADVPWMSAFLELVSILDQQAASVSGSIAAFSVYSTSFYPMSILLVQEAALLLRLLLLSYLLFALPFLRFMMG